MTDLPNLTRETIEQQTDFRLAVTCIDALAPGGSAGLIGYHDEHERLTEEYGCQNVLGSLYVDEGKLVLGIFMRRDLTIEGKLASPALETLPQLHSGEEEL